MAYACEPYVTPGVIPCGSKHCTQFAGTTDEKAWCKCLDWNNKPIPGCDPKSNTVPVYSNTCYNKSTGEQEDITQDQCQDLRDVDRNWAWTKCWCCCSCFAWDTRIKTGEDEVRFIQDIEENDQVLAAYLEEGTGGALKVTWKPKMVSFSDGTSPGGDPSTVILVQFGDDGEVIATPDQLFLMPDGKLKDAVRLVPGDHLVDDTGAPVEVKAVVLGDFDGGIHHLGLGPAPDDPHVPVSGNLFSANGVISGDFWLQVTYGSGADAPGTALVKNRDALPRLGTEEYAGAGAYEADLFSARLPGTELRPITSAHFMPLQAAAEPALPADAQRYFTFEQAAALKKAPHYPPSMETNRSDFQWMKRLFEGFFPDVNLYLEWTDETPNLYAFEQYGQKTVYVSGRLLRIKEMYWQGLAMVAAHGLAVFLAGSGKEGQKYPCVAQADNFGAGYILRQSFNFYWSETASEGYNQVKGLFSHVPERPAKGDPADLCGRPSLACRLESIGAAIQGVPIPACSGVPAPGRLELRRAVPSFEDRQQRLLVSFNEAVGESADDPGRYVITPETSVMTAQRDPEDPSQVVLDVRFPRPPQGEYSLAVDDIRSADGSTLNPFGKTVYFTVDPIDEE